MCILLPLINCSCDQHPSEYPFTLSFLYVCPTFQKAFGPQGVHFEF